MGGSVVALDILCLQDRELGHCTALCRTTTRLFMGGKKLRGCTLAGVVGGTFVSIFVFCKAELIRSMAMAIRPSLAPVYPDKQC